ncbi:hypothetical protein ACQUET_02165 [Lactococcus lactis]|uniref:Uncharacterized protein n=1 Tax=Lactococcus lactis subsp. lactis TaxID=1360 RepID=A0A2R7Y0J4_LACLL|nr:hypothetical protein [Lactococcus lactis]PUA16140.1 hypothetical protein CYU10_000568 [Lactococcus lactis subsp. lactis]
MSRTGTTRQDMMEISLNQIIRKNLTIRSLSMILGEMMSELVNDADLVAYSGNFEEINTLLDCILDESNGNDFDLDEFRTHFEKLLTRKDVDTLGRIDMSDLAALDKALNLPEMSVYEAVKKIRAKRTTK